MPLLEFLRTRLTPDPPSKDADIGDWLRWLEKERVPSKRFL